MDDISEMKRRINEILAVIEEFVSGKFDVSVPVGKNMDVIDALATGINMMIEEVREKTAKLKKSSDKLESKIEELERFNKLAVDRELKMIGLKRRIKELESKNRRA